MDPGSLLFLVLTAGLVYLLISRTRRQQRRQAAVQADLAPGRRIMTTAGLFATVVAVEDDAVVLETAPGQHSRWARPAVARVLPEPAEDPAPPVDDGEADRDP
jgi:preprotein translocase subunit YajC